MEERARGMTTPRAESPIGLAIAVIGVLTIVVARAVDIRWALIVGSVLVIIGAIATVDPLVPEHRKGTRIWESDPGA